MEETSIQEAVKEYNKYRSPRTTAEILNITGEELRVKFEGSFCRSCGIVEYFKDLVYELERKGIDAEFLDFEEKGDQRFIGRYSLSEDE